MPGYDIKHAPDAACGRGRKEDLHDTDKERPLRERSCQKAQI